MVDRRLRTDDGPVFWGELTGEYGVLWLPSRMRQPGSYAHGGRVVVSEVTSWGRWNVAVIEASVGRALRGFSYYDVATGWLVGYERELVGERHVLLTLKQTNAGP